MQTLWLHTVTNVGTALLSVFKPASMFTPHELYFEQHRLDFVEFFLSLTPEEVHYIICSWEEAETDVVVLKKRRRKDFEEQHK